MGIPQVPDRVRRVPALAVRAVFAGIGRILLAADRPLTRAGQVVARTAGDGGQPRQLPAQRPGPVAPPGSRWRSLDQTGNVRLLSDEDPDDDESGPDRSRCQGPSGQAHPQPALPLVNYDDLSLASIRARLRGLDAGQLRILAEYEGKNAGRPEMIGMFRRRIAKLEEGE